MKITIRPTCLEELDEVMPFYDRARLFMATNGNANQWINGYPAPDDIRRDILNGNSYVFVNEGKELEGIFTFIQGEDPNYRIIEKGAWLNDNPYGVIHRIASRGRVKGLMDICLEWCAARCPNLRVDTHKDNKVLQNILHKNGFTYCGIIYVSNGTERLAFQRVS
ncbi:GNAT family N-acetyltransferase [Bacteroides sp.]